jgi:hypothetical protein
MRWLSLLLVGLFFGFVGCGGADVPTALCNECSGPAYTEAGCDGMGSDVGCESSKLESVTNDACNVGAAPTTHRRCTFTNCDKAPECPGL